MTARAPLEAATAAAVFAYRDHLVERGHSEAHAVAQAEQLIPALEAVLPAAIREYLLARAGQIKRAGYP